ncbi:hypothetical protein [Streptomyces adelaidensis]|uniref:hypothetical protein n=1 Tax=Streptomyces adelaidensis TaxID=2796465 RepID=UPI001905901B|nr:hypothetical protein [Streptomyces adelaidensis]
MTSKLTGRYKRRMAAAGMACVAMLGAAVITAPNASAAANRRVCVYGGIDFIYDNSGNTTGYYYWGMNYKRDGGCPTNPSSTSVKQGAESYSTEKVTCEDFAEKFVLRSYDPCPNDLIKDKMYKVALEGWSTSNPKVKYYPYS